MGVHASLNLSSDALTENNGQWSIGYSYDNNGNLLTKTDARATTTTFTYDALNRATQRSYSSGSAVATPTVTYTYDASGVANSKGRLTSTSSSVSAYNLTGYDSLGRVTGSQQVTDGQTYSMSYAYDLAGNMTSQTYPTGRVVTQNFDEAGRLASISGQASGGTPKTYANSFGYAAHGALERMRLANGRWEHTNFNERLQPTEIGIGSSSTDSSLLKLSYDYGTISNNGDVLKQVITVPTVGTATGFTATQHYQYDQLNRLTGAQEVDGGTSTTWQSTGTLWQQMFSYDRYGNRAVATTNTTSTMIGPNPDISASTNRIVPRPSPVEYYRYDDAGNLDREKSGETLAYDAENKMVQYQGGATQTGGADYSYDGDGRRVKKARAAETLIFVYNIAGQLVAEYTSSTPQNNGTSYLTSDTLGTPRVNTKADGSVRARHDYLPFGEELYAGVGNRTDQTGQGYDQALSPSDQTSQRFTGYVLDRETGFSYAQARYYLSYHGRFSSPDPFLGSGKRYIPQSWNRYSYCLNDPIVLTDPSGLEWGYYLLGEGKASIVWFEGKAGRYKGRQYMTLDFGRSATKVLNLTGGGQLQIFKDGGSSPLGPNTTTPPQQRTDDETLPAANLAVIRRVGSEPYGKAAGAFAIAAITGGLNVAGSPILLLDAAAAAGMGMHEVAEREAAEKEQTAAAANAIIELSTRSVPFTLDQQAVVDLAKQYQRNGVSPQEARILIQWAKEYGIRARGPEVHPNRTFGSQPHMHIGPINHIPVK